MRKEDEEKLVHATDIAAPLVVKLTRLISEQTGVSPELATLAVLIGCYARAITLTPAATEPLLTEFIAAISKDAPPDTMLLALATRRE
jgi:hypothetical protein